MGGCEIFNSTHYFTYAAPLFTVRQCWLASEGCRQLWVPTAKREQKTNLPIAVQIIANNSQATSTLKRVFFGGSCPTANPSLSGSCSHSIRTLSLCVSGIWWMSPSADRSVLGMHEWLISPKQDFFSNAATNGSNWNTKGDELCRPASIEPSIYPTTPRRLFKMSFSAWLKSSKCQKQQRPPQCQ